MQIIIIAPTHHSAMRYYQKFVDAHSRQPLFLSVEQAEENLRGARDCIMLLVDLPLSTTLRLRSYHGGRNTLVHVTAEYTLN